MHFDFILKQNKYRIMKVIWYYVKRELENEDKLSTLSEFSASEYYPHCWTPECATSMYYPHYWTPQSTTSMYYSHYCAPQSATSLHYPHYQTPQSATSEQYPHYWTPQGATSMYYPHYWTPQSATSEYQPQYWIPQFKKRNNITWNHLNAPKILIKTKLAWMSFYGINVYTCIIVFISQCY